MHERVGPLAFGHDPPAHAAEKGPEMKIHKTAAKGILALLAALVLAAPSTALAHNCDSHGDEDEETAAPE